MIEVVIPMEPDNALFPNAIGRGGHWGKRSKSHATCRQVARYAAMESGMHLEPIEGPVALTIHVGYGYRRVKPDLDATISACKPFIDGLVDAGILVDDDQVQKITATHEKLPSKRGHQAKGFTRIHIEETES